MAKCGKMQRVMLGTLAVMMVVSLVLAVMAFATPAPVSAGGPGFQPRWACYGYVCFQAESCWLPPLYKTHYFCTNWCQGHGGQWRCFGSSGCQWGC